MAQDLTGLLGGALLPAAQPITPTSAQDYTRIMQEANKGFSQAVGGMFGVDTRTTAEFVQEEVAKLNPESVEDQAKIVELVGKINPAGAVALKSAFAQKAAEKDILTAQTNAFENYVAKTYPELTGLVSKGVITPSNFKQFLADKKDAGTVVKGTTFTVQDEAGNAFTMIPTLNNKTGKFENKFAPVGGGPAQPVGKTVITGGEFAQTAAEDALRQINKDISTTEGQEFVKNKATALDTIPVLSAQKEELSQALTLLDSVETGGPINLAGTALENYFGTKSADKATLEIILGDNTFKALKPLFGGLISEGERREIVKIYPNLQKGNAANKGIILRLQNILDNALLRGQMYQRSDTVEDYKRLMDKLYPVNANAEPTENVVIWGARDK
jgi:hypothetical protein